MSGGKAKNLYKRGAIWWGRAEVAGREHRATLRTADLAEAKTRYKAWRTGLERDTLGIKEDHGFEEAAVKFVAEVLPTVVKPSVVTRYTVSLAQLARVFRPLRMSEINTETISQYITLRRNEVTNATLQRDLTALGWVLGAAVSWGWRADNPATAYDRKMLRHPRKVIRPPTPAELALVLETAPPGMRAVLRLLDQTGMREAEAVTLDHWNVDWQRHQILLVTTKTSRPRALVWATPGGDAGPVLLAQARIGGPLFLSAQGTVYANFASNFRRIMQAAIRQAEAAGQELRPFRVHDLRHGFAIRWLKSGGSIYRLSKHLGHTSVKTTEGYLSYLTAEEKEAVDQAEQGSAQNPAQRAENRQIVL